MRYRTNTDKQRDRDERNKSRVELLKTGKSLREILSSEGKTARTVDAILRQWLKVGKIDQEEYDANCRPESKPAPTTRLKTAPPKTQHLPQDLPSVEELELSDLPFTPGVFVFQGLGKPKKFLGLNWNQKFLNDL